MLAALLTACPGPPDQAGGAAAAVVPPARPVVAPAAAAPLPASNQLVYTGTIGPYPVVLNLQLSDTTARVTARYYYLRRGSDLALTGSRAADSLHLGETPEPPQDDYYEATARLHARRHADSLITGYWQAEGKRLRLPVKLRRRRQAYDYAYAARVSSGEQTPYARIFSVVYTDDAPEAEDGMSENGEPYTLVSYPLVLGLADHRAEAALNDWLASESREVAWPRTRLVPGQQYAWWNGCYLRTTRIERLTAELVSVVRRDETQSCSRPPYQVQEQHTTRRLSDLRPYRLDELLQGNYRALFRRCIREQVPTQLTAEVAEAGGRANDPDNRCRSADVGRLLQARLDTARTTDGLLVGAAGLSICYYNFSEFCSWPVMGTAAVVVPYEALRPYVRPGSALARALPAAARKP